MLTYFFLFSKLSCLVPTMKNARFAKVFKRDRGRDCQAIICSIKFYDYCCYYCYEMSSNGIAVTEWRGITLLSFF